MRLLKILEGRGVQKQPQSSRNQPNSAQAKGGMAMSRILEYKSVKGLCLFLAVTVFLTTCPVPVRAYNPNGKDIQILTENEMKVVKGGACGGCDPNPDDCQACSGSNTVALASGEESVDETDMLVPGRGDIPLKMQRTYLSRINSVPSCMGWGWITPTFGDYLIEDEQTEDVTEYTASGGTNFYDWNGSQFVSAADNPWTLTKITTNTFTLRNLPANEDKKFDTYRNPKVYLTYIEDRKNNQTDYNYDNGGRVTKITDPTNRSLNLKYAVQGYLTAVIGPEDKTVTYTYEQLGQDYSLSQVTDPEGNTTRYTYYDNANLYKIIDRESNTTTFTYDANDRCV
ncbi:RHS repeat protein, partial [Candidatus Peregrinibacteria bacterium]|nr:RHS repeat protein [Candidatus Peregrinibacteria bacterium]